MSQPPSISFDDVLGLLRGSPVQEFEAGYVATRGYAVTEDWGNSLKLAKELAFAQIARSTIEELLVSRRDLLGRFVDGLLALPEDDVEWPDGEEQDSQPEPVPSHEPIKMGRGFSITAACSVWMLLERTDVALVEWLKFRRVPHHREHAQELRRIISQCGA
jgi:hypothetical protein